MKGGILAAALLLGLGLTTAVAHADDLGPRQPGQHVYDRASVLTPDQAAGLERDAQAVDRAGAPAVVFIRARTADDATTRQEARDLMDAWSVESSPGARDGLVLLVDLRPEDLHHGSAALVAGRRHAESGRLSDDRLQAIYDDSMRPRLVGGDLAGALSAGLSAAAADLATPPGPTPVGTTPARDPVELLVPGGVIAGIVALILVLVRRGRNREWSPVERSPQPWTEQQVQQNSWIGPDVSSSGVSAPPPVDGGASSGGSSGGGSF